MSRLALMLLVSTIAACGNTIPRTEVVLVIDAEPIVRSQTHDVQLVVRGGTGAIAQWQERLDRTLNLGEHAWPLEVGLVPLGGDASRVYEATASARAISGAAVARVRAVSGYRAGETLMLRLVLEDGCRDKVNACGASQTCRAGTCMDANVDVTALEPYKPHAEVDSGQDASPGPMDAAGDAENLDANIADSTAPDASSADATVDATTDASGTTDTGPVLGDVCDACESRYPSMDTTVENHVRGTCASDLWCQTTTNTCQRLCYCTREPTEQFCTRTSDQCDLGQTCRLLNGYTVGLGGLAYDLGVCTTFGTVDEALACQ